MATVEGFAPGLIGQGMATPGGSNGSPTYGLLDGTGAQVVMDFFTKAAIDGKQYQVRAGTLTTPLVGDVVITDTAAEFCIDTGQQNITLIPVYQDIAVRLGGGTLFEYAVKEVATASSAGTAFVPLPFKPNGQSGAASTARVSAAGGVTVTAELATTTIRHWAWSQPIAAGAYVTTPPSWQPRTVFVKGTSASTATARCLYVQVAATGTGPSYYGHLNYLEFTNASLGSSY